jgi:ferredoxin
VKRKIIKIDEEKCNGCGLCIPNCPEGAIQMIDGKARLVSDLFCDGLGACIGECPQDAISIEEREAEKYDEDKVMDNIIKQGKNVIKAHLKHLESHNEIEYLKQAIGYLKKKGIKNPLDDNKDERNLDDKKNSKSTCKSSEQIFQCPGSRVVDFTEDSEAKPKAKPIPRRESELCQWPIKIRLVPPSAPYLKDADLLIAADCIPFAKNNFHEDFLKGKILLIGCPKFDDYKLYMEKITEILKQNNIKSITCVHMEVPCCFGFIRIIQEAITDSGKDISLKEINISIKGDIIS